MFARFAVSVGIGFLGAYPLAEASGLLGNRRILTESQEPVVVVSGGSILFFLTLALIGPTLGLLRQILETLAKVEERPRPSVAWTMLVLGTICAIAAMQIQYNAGIRPPASVSMNIPGFTTTTPALAMQPPSTLGLSILTFLTFLLGASLIGLGIWASLKPSATAPTIARIVKPEAPELAEVAT